MCMNIINVDEVQKEDSLDVVGVSDEDIDDWESAMHLVVANEHSKYHFGTGKVFRTLHANGWPISFRVVKVVVDKCDVCTFFRTAIPIGPMGQPISSSRSGEVVYQDAIGPVTPRRRGVRFLLSIIDYATRVADVTVWGSMRASNVTKALDRWVSEKGPVKMIVTDNASYFASKRVRNWCSLHAVSHVFCPPYYHKAIGVVERYQKTLEDRLRRMRFAGGGVWSDYISDAVYGINHSWHEALGAIPSQLWDASQEERDKAFERIKGQRERDDKGRHFIHQEFSIGDLVLVYDSVAAMAREDKFAPRWRGPMKVVERVSTCLWRVRSENKVGQGRRPTLIFHRDHMQLWPLGLNR